MKEQAAITTIQYQPDSWETIQSKCQWLVKSEMLPKGIDKPEKAAAIILKGSELGIPAMEAFAQIHIINGKPTCSAELQLGLLARGRVTYKFTENTEDRATVVFYRPGFEPYESTFSIEDAKRADLLKNPTWRQYPKAMLRARAISAGARVIGPDLIGGMSYTPEELGATVDFETGEVIQAEAEVIDPVDPPAPQSDLDKLKSKAAEMVKDGVLTKEQYKEIEVECAGGMTQGRIAKYIERFGQLIKGSLKATPEEIQALVDRVEQAVLDGVLDPDMAETMVSTTEDNPKISWVKAQMEVLDVAYKEPEKGESNG